MPAKRKRKISRKTREAIEAYVLLLPTLVGLVVFTAGAVIAAFLISFTRWDIVTPAEWIGIGNYQRLATEPLFWKVLGNTFYYTILSVPLSLVLSLILALALNQKIRGVTIYRTMYFLPVVSSTVAVSLVWYWMYNPEFGLINYALAKLFKINGPAWLSSTKWAMPAIIIMSVWKGLGYNMVIFLAGLQGVPQELYEAARIDGATGWQQFRNITLPMISPTTFFVLVMSTISSFQVFEQTYIMTKGGPAYSTLTLVYYVFQQAFQWYHMGYAAALAYVLFAVILVITLLQATCQRRWVHY